MHAKSPQLCMTLCGAMDYSPPGSCVLGISQARILEWVAMPSSKKSIIYHLWYSFIVKCVWGHGCLLTFYKCRATLYVSSKCEVCDCFSLVQFHMLLSLTGDLWQGGVGIVFLSTFKFVYQILLFHAQIFVLSCVCDRSAEEGYRSVLSPKHMNRKCLGIKAGRKEIKNLIWSGFFLS